jgi:ribosomal protein S18 acetylase RimI-like enzyme
MGWLAYINDDLVGYTVVQEGYKLADMIRLGVLPPHQRKGVGRRLLTLALAHFGTVMLCCRVTNEPARLLYGSTGFRIIGKLQSPIQSWVMVFP